MERFVGVRVIQGNAIDLSVYQFDYDLTFAAFFMNADGTIYGRFGTRSSREAMDNISTAGFRKALAAALEIHRGYPGNRASLEGKRGPAPRFPVPEKYPGLASYRSELDYAGNVVKSCIHCHQIIVAERKALRSARKPIPDRVLFPWPLPVVVGLELDAAECATVRAVTPGSPAARGGFRPGDRLLSLEGQPLVSIADVQWVLHRAGDADRLDAIVRRGDRERTLALDLEAGWRRRGDISWRASTWDLRRMATGGLVLEDLDAADRREAGLEGDALALRVRGMGQYRPHDAAKRAGFRKGDVIVALDGEAARRTPSQLLAWILERRLPGDRVPATVLRAGKRVNLELPVRE